MNITKEEFDNAYNKYLPNKFIIFAYKYFSKTTEKKDMWLNSIIVYILIALFLGGFVATIIDKSNDFIKIFTILYAIILTTLCGGITTAMLMNNWRIRKIRKFLGITKWEYNNLVDKYYPL